MGDWVDVVSKPLSGLLALLIAVLTWVFKRELNRNDDQMKRLEQRIEVLEHNGNGHITRAEADARFRQIETDIKTSGQQIQETVREVEATVNKRLDTIILSLSRSDRHAL
jgi:hypothetical protein